MRGRKIKPALLALEDGRVFRGAGFGADADAEGELVFNTAMTGYQEVLTDPSYRGQMVVMTYPHIGNYGVIPGDEESRRVWVEAFIVKEVCRRHSNFRANGDLDSYLKEQGVPGVEGVDTRALTRHIREAGALRAILSSKRSGRSEPHRARQGESRAGRARHGAGRHLCGRARIRRAEGPPPLRGLRPGGQGQHFPRVGPKVRSRKSCRLQKPPRACWRESPPPFSSRTAPATRRRSATSSRTCGTSWAGFPSWAFVSGTRFSRRHWAAGRTSSSSATTGRTTPSRI